MTTKEFEIIVLGCDDETIVNIQLTYEQYEGVAILAYAVNKTSTYGCQPQIIMGDGGYGLHI